MKKNNETTWEKDALIEEIAQSVKALPEASAGRAF